MRYTNNKYGRHEIVDEEKPTLREYGVHVERGFLWRTLRDVSTDE